MKIKPIGKRVLIKIIENKTVTKGGILIPDTTFKDDANIGEVIAVGTLDLALEISVGNKIIYKSYSGTEIKDGDSHYILLDQKDVLGLVEVE